MVAVLIPEFDSFESPVGGGAVAPASRRLRLLPPPAADSRTELAAADPVARTGRPSRFPAAPPSSPTIPVRPVRRPAPTPRHPARRHPAAVYRRRRILALGVVAVVGLGAWAGLRSLLAAPSTLGAVRPISQRVVVVKPGDTLWSIALQATGGSGDIRPLVFQLENEVHGQPLYVGERIALP